MNGGSTLVVANILGGICGCVTRLCLALKHVFRIDNDPSATDSNHVGKL